MQKPHNSTNLVYYLHAEMRLNPNSPELKGKIAGVLAVFGQEELPYYSEVAKLFEVACRLKSLTLVDAFHKSGIFTDPSYAVEAVDNLFAVAPFCDLSFMRPAVETYWKDTTKDSVFHAVKLIHLSTLDKWVSKPPPPPLKDKK